jgi:hypothetical protein
MVPLLFISSLITGCVLQGCSTHVPASRFFATGFTTDHGVNRIWREDTQNGQPQTLISVFTPYQGNESSMTRYEYLQGKLFQIKQTYIDSSDLSITIRFDTEGNVIFMQRQLATGKEPLSADDIARYRYDATTILTMSNVLHAGNVVLEQGRWEQGKISSCANQPVKLSLDVRSQVLLAKSAAKSNDRLALAWLNSPKGDELLLVANADFCHWQPKEADLK